jgi:hypothetical protein
MNSIDDIFDSITVSTTTTRTYSMRMLDNKYDERDEFDQHKTFHSLVSIKEDNETLRILTNDGVVRTVELYKKETTSFAVLEKGTHKIDPDNAYDPTIKVHKRTSPEIEGVSCVLTSDKYDPIYTKLNYSDFLFFMNIL